MQNISRKNAIKLIDETQNIVERELDFEKYFESKSIKKGVERTEVEVAYEGVSNGFLSEILYAITGYDVEVYGEVEKLFICPCCGLRTLTEIYNPAEGTGYDICPYCKWEDDGTTDKNAYRSINKGSMEDYRNNIQNNFNRYYINKWFDK